MKVQYIKNPLYRMDRTTDSKQQYPTLTKEQTAKFRRALNRTILGATNKSAVLEMKKSFLQKIDQLIYSLNNMSMAKVQTPSNFEASVCDQICSLIKVRQKNWGVFGSKSKFDFSFLYNSKYTNRLCLISELIHQRQRDSLVYDEQKKVTQYYGALELIAQQIQRVELMIFESIESNYYQIYEGRPMESNLKGLCDYFIDISRCCKHIQTVQNDLNEKVGSLVDQNGLPLESQAQNFHEVPQTAVELQFGIEDQRIHQEQKQETGTQQIIIEESPTDNKSQKSLIEQLHEEPGCQTVAEHKSESDESEMLQSRSDRLRTDQSSVEQIDNESLQFIEEQSEQASLQVNQLKELLTTNKRSLALSSGSSGVQKHTVINLEEDLTKGLRSEVIELQRQSPIQSRQKSNSGIEEDWAEQKEMTVQVLQNEGQAKRQPVRDQSSTKKVNEAPCLDVETESKKEGPEQIWLLEASSSLPKSQVIRKDSNSSVEEIE